MKAVKFPLEIKRGSVSIKIYRALTHGSESFTLSYYLDGKRERTAFADFKEARSEADKVVCRLASSDVAVLALSGEDRAGFLRAKELLSQADTPIEIAAAEYAHAKRALGAVPLARAVEYYLKCHPTEIKPVLVEAVVEEMITAKKKDGLSAGYIKHLTYDLNKFAKDFQCNIGRVTGTQIDEWLRDLGVAPRTLNNLRNSIQALFNFAKGRRHLPKDHDELDAVAVMKNRDGEIEIFTPDEIVEVLSEVTDPLIPFFACGAFAGIRHAEILRLDWKDIRFDDGLIEIGAAQAKTASRRLVPLSDNLRAWLTPHKKPHGPVCRLRNAAAEIYRLVARINQERREQWILKGGKARDFRKEDKFKWKHNALRHSFISYRVALTQNVAQVALEAGNSPQIIFKNYRELVRPKDAERWFAIAPDDSGGKIVDFDDAMVA